MKNMFIRKMELRDWECVAAIYKQGIDSKKATFEEEVPSFERFDQGHLNIGRLVAVNEKDIVLGWVSLSPFSNRSCFSGVAEISIYIDANSVGKGIGSLLMESVIKESERAGLWSLYSGIFPENVSSLKLHQKYGFRQIGYREKVGKSSDGTFKDVIYLERRSQIVGV
ncbi:MAG TPA: N-acetyltransferase [Firmicutes bacterium]|nr:N-acetyltransferase [Bacillota bacterium]